MSLNNSIITQSIGIPYQQYVTSSAGHTLVSSSTYFNDTSDNIPRYKDASGNIYDAIISSSYALTASHALNSGGGSAFPFTGDAQITGSLTVSGSNIDFSGSTSITSSENVLYNHGTFNAITKNGNSGGDIIFSTKDEGNVGTTGWFLQGGNGSGGGDGEWISLGAYAPDSGNKARFVDKHRNAANPSWVIGYGSSANRVEINTNTHGYAFFDSSLHVAQGSNTYALKTTGTSKIGGNIYGEKSITGSLIISSSTSESLSVQGSGSTVFDVIGSQGTLFSVDDDLSGTLFTANDISGLPVLEASASGELYFGKSPQSLYTTAVISSTTANITQSIYGLSTSSYEGVFVDYTATSASNARAGNMTAIWNGSSLNFTETTTTDIGDTSNLIMQVAISQSQAQVQSYSTAASYKIKTIIRSI